MIKLSNEIDHKQKYAEKNLWKMALKTGRNGNKQEWMKRFSVVDLKSSPSSDLSQPWSLWCRVKKADLRSKRQRRRIKQQRISKARSQRWTQTCVCVSALISELSDVFSLCDLCFFLSLIIPDAHFWPRQRRFNLIRLKTCQGLTQHLFSCVFGKITCILQNPG